MKIYTRTGDRGKTVNADQTPVKKNDDRLHAIGTIDELNSYLGLSCSFLKDTDTIGKIERIQRELFQLGSLLSGTPNITFQSNNVTMLEEEIDAWTNKIPSLQNFILPGGVSAGAILHVARAVCRRAERQVVTFAQQHEVDPVVLQYINRLSDWLFTLARYTNIQAGMTETTWSGKR